MNCLIGLRAAVSAAARRYACLIYVRQVRVKHLELTLRYMENFFKNGFMTMKFHILNVHEGLGTHAKYGRCALSRSGEIHKKPLT